MFFLNLGFELRAFLGRSLPLEPFRSPDDKHLPLSHCLVMCPGTGVRMENETCMVPHPSPTSWEGRSNTIKWWETGQQDDKLVSFHCIWLASFIICWGQSHTCSCADRILLNAFIRPQEPCKKHGVSGIKKPQWWQKMDRFMVDVGGADRIYCGTGSKTEDMAKKE